MKGRYIFLGVFSVVLIYSYIKDHSNSKELTPKKVNDIPEKIAYLTVEESKKLVYDFCYSVQAAALCDDLSIKIGTEEKVTLQVGGEFRSPNQKYSQECKSGLWAANDEKQSLVCNIAWKKYGCYGNEEPRLIQQNPFTNKNGVFCSY